MVKISEKNRVFYRYYSIFLACLSSLIGVVLYLLAHYVFPFPDGWLGVNSNKKLLFLGIQPYIATNMVTGILFTVISLLSNSKQVDVSRRQKNQHWIRRILTILFSIIYGVLSQGLSWNWTSFLWILTVVVVNCGLELMIKLMNNYGICDAFSLLFLIDTIPYDWFASHLVLKNDKLLSVSWLFVITFFFTSITSLKWEAPIEDNNLFSDNNSRYFRKKKFRLGFKINFSFTSLFYLSEFMNTIFPFASRTSLKSSFSEITENLKETLIMKIDPRKSYDRTRVTWEYIGKKESSKVISSLLAWNEVSNPFNFQTFKILATKTAIPQVGISTFAGFILIRGLVSWIQIRFSTLNAREISKELRNNGIYIDGVPFGLPTEKLLGKTVNWLFLTWFITTTFFNTAFDNLVADGSLGSLTNGIRFVSWFNCVNTGISLIEQIRTRFKYISGK